MSPLKDGVVAERGHLTELGERALLLEIEKTMRYLVRSRSFSPLNETEFRTVRSMLDRLDEARRSRRV